MLLTITHCREEIHHESSFQPFCTRIYFHSTVKTHMIVIGPYGPSGCGRANDPNPNKSRIRISLNQLKLSNTQIKMQEKLLIIWNKLRYEKLTKNHNHKHEVKFC